MATPVTQPGTTDDPTQLPALAASLTEKPGHRLAFQAHACGVQIYPWDAASQTFGKARPDAVLMVAKTGEIIHHFKGPTWQAADQSLVTGIPVAGNAACPDPSAIPWVELKATPGGTPSGKLSNVAFIRRLFTRGGIAPAANPAGLAEVPVYYEAEYYFYEPLPPADGDPGQSR